MDAPSMIPLERSSFISVRWLYLLQVCVRFGWGNFLTPSAYIHPDEYFQSIEIINTLEPFARNGKIPWEFANCANPCRSILPPLFMTGIPTFLVYFVSELTGGNLVRFTDSSVLISIRLWTTIVSLMIDGIVLSLIRKLTRSSVAFSSLFTHYMLLYLVTSWTSEIFSVRTFSNSMENWFFILFTYGYHQLRTAILYNQITNVPRHRYILFWSVFIGCCTTIGIWTRFTYILFIFPFVLALILLFLIYPWIYPWVMDTNSNRTTTINNLQRLRKDTGLSILYGIISCIGSMMIVIVIDSLFFGSLTYNYPFTFRGYYTVTPINSFAYNLRVENLALHGLHPFYNHALVNMFLLYGPAWFGILLYTVYLIGKYLRIFIVSPVLSLRSGLENIFALTTTMELSFDHFRYLLHSVILFSLVFLSMAPHQEPRFLVPLLYPVGFTVSGIGCTVYYLVHSSSEFGWKIVFRTIVRPLIFLIWILFNLVLGIFYGNLHQNGVIPSLRLIARYEHEQYNGPSRTVQDVPTYASLSSSYIQFPFLSYVQSYTPPSWKKTGKNISSSFSFSDERIIPLVKQALYYSTYTPPQSILFQARTPSTNDLTNNLNSFAAPWCRDPSIMTDKDNGNNNDDYDNKRKNYAHPPSFVDNLQVTEVHNVTTLLSKFIFNSQRNYGTFIVTPHHLVPDIERIIRLSCITLSSSNVCTTTTMVTKTDDTYNDTNNDNVTINSTAQCISSPLLIIYPLYSIWPHISTESWPPNVNDASLDILYTACVI